MELSNEQMKRVIEELESSYNSKMFEDKNLSAFCSPVVQPPLIN